MGKRRLPCDVPTCTHERYRWQRLCDSCFRQLPHRIRTAILDHWRFGNRKLHRQACRDAARYFATRTSANDDFDQDPGVND